jgi:hypothetical protein
VAAARQQLQLLQAELDGARIRAAAERQAADTGRGSLAREAAAAEQQRRAAAELLRQLEAREDALGQVGEGRGWTGDYKNSTVGNCWKNERQPQPTPAT